jgi:hypothetical protein
MSKLGRPKSCGILKEQTSVFVPPSQNKLQEAATQASPLVAHNIPKRNKLFSDSETTCVEA